MEARLPARGPLGKPFLPIEQALLANDGWLAVVRVNPYRVDWRTPLGMWILGRPLNVPTIRMDSAEIAFYTKLHAAYKDPQVEWPEMLPPVVAAVGPLATSDGKIVISRTPSATYPGQRYDVVDRNGVLERQIILPDNERIVGFGTKTVYLVTVNADGQRLSRRAWP